jgi:hypothetical protein
MINDEEFLKAVELHERTWGVRQYRGRPKLSQILESNVVVFWKDNKKLSWRITLHDDMTGIEAEYKRILFRLVIQYPEVVIDRIYVNRQRIYVSGVKFTYSRTPILPDRK